MTVQDTTPSVTHVGDGIDVSFPFTFRVDDIAWLSVDFVTNFDQFLLNADQDASPGGSAEYTVAPPNLQELTILRTTAKTQLLDYTRYDPFDSESHEDALDKLTMLIQDTCFSFEDHILDTDIHFSDAPADGMYYSRRNNAWEVNPIVAGPFDHMALINIGSNDHFAIDAHIANTSIHFGDALATGIIYGRQNNAWVPVPTDDPWIEFTAVSGNPGTVPANTLFMDDGTLHDPNTVAMGDLTVPMLLTTNVGFGDPGTEQGGINVGGVTFDAHVKINDIGGSLDATFILHRHSTANPPIMVFARTASDTAAHVAVAASDTLASLLFTGWSGTHYDIAAVLDIRVPAGSTVSPTSLPSEMLFYTVPDLSNTAALALQLNSDQSVRLSDAYTFPNVDGVDGQVLVTDGAGNLAFGNVSSGLLTGQYRFSSSTVAADPGPGRFRYDTGAYGTVTQIFIDDVTLPGVDISNILALITTDDRLYIQGEDDGDEFAVWNVTAPATDNGGWFTIDVALEASGVFLGNNDRVLFVLQLDGASAGVSDHGALTGLVPDDDHTQYLLDGVGRAIPQSLIGGLAAGDALVLTGASSSPDVGIVQVDSPVTFTYDTFSNTTPAQQFLMSWAPNPSITSNYIGGCLSTAAVFDISTAVFIPAIFSDTNRYNVGAAPGFSAITFINELSVVANDGSFNLPSALVMNIGLTHERNTSGTSTTPGTTGISFSPQTRATVAGAVMTKTDQTAVRCSPTWSTVGGSTVNLGTVRGVHVFNPTNALFQPGAGTENVAGIIGIDFNQMSSHGSAIKAVVRSAMTALDANTSFLLNNGNAHSDHGGGHIYFDDNAGIAYGGVGKPAFDVWQTWNAAGYFRTYFNSGAPSELRWSNPANGRFLFDNDGGSVDGEYNFNCAKFSMGAQTGAVGNQVGVFVTGARSTGLGGEWSDFLLTQAANLTVDHAMGGVFGWTINAPSMTIGTGSVTTAGALNVGGNVNQGSVNRFGIRVISNPSGGSGVNAALWITAGLSRFDGRVDINNGIALGGGAIPTLGTIGGGGPTAAAQAQWVEIDIGGVAHWIPAWT